MPEHGAGSRAADTPMPGQRFRALLRAESAQNAAGNAENRGSNRNDGSPIAADPLTARLFRLARRVAAQETTVLITGPSGSGKDVMARFLHRESTRAQKPFLAINCAALPEAMLEALLFGHERGAFTGAQNAAPGLFRAADHGTLFLDELGELPLALQAKLLRAVELGEFLPLGATKMQRADVRILAATNRDLAREVEEGRFRADLFWRLSVFPLEMPPLADRPGDILPLAARILAGLGVTVPPAAEALAALLRHDWPGNVRELGNVLERAAILAAGAPIAAGQLFFHGATGATPAAALADTLQSHERRALRTALEASDGRRIDAARLLGISERTLRYKLAALAGRPRNPARAAPSRSSHDVRGLHGAEAVPA